MDTNSLADTLLKRFDCLQEIVKQPAEKRTLVASLEMPRSTLDDVVRELEQQNLIEYQDGKWHPTTFGRLAYQSQKEHIEFLTDLEKSKSIIEPVDPNCPLSPEFIQSADVHEPHPNVAGDLMAVVIDEIQDSTEIRIATPRVVAGYHDQFYQSCISDEKDSIEIILPRKVYNWLSSEYPEDVKEISELSSLKILCAEIPFSFGLTIVDNMTAIVVVFAERGIFGLIINDTDSALDWANEVYAQIRENAIPITASEEVGQELSYSE
ncbi:helix-turn-helix transcriptional regulator [Halopiger xanaduensis]|uniref:Methanogenesis regulatory protein FilR1 middle domain-containing protein n=1 Tax=Halopiger xanaduensis (strain DSM 18323 / JCM 14033 / SH-6) TaxID=797210 RepID=F8DE23_HALXS|nr:hypothetical protein [Halopiger xanaduensis]AEH39299.1 hypothetical protein Halxa_0046 [Halopiger xanaduensis SH-6]